MQFFLACLVGDLSSGVIQFGQDALTNVESRRKRKLLNKLVMKFNWRVTNLI